MTNEKSGKDGGGQKTGKPLTERIEKGAYKGPSAPQTVQPQQVINPRPTTQQGGAAGAGQQSTSDSSTDK